MSEAASDALHARVQAFIAMSLRGGASEPFDALALALARFQAAQIPALERLARARGADLLSAASADAIPAVPCDVFRFARVAAHPPSADCAVFRTSGTSQGRAARGEHAFRTTTTYELVALAWAERFLWPDLAQGRSGPERLVPIVLVPSRSEQTDSSLGFMLDLFARHLNDPRGIRGAAQTFHLRGGALDVASVASAAAAARATGEPAIVLATSFALVHLLELAEGRDLRLPPGSRVMQTGGFKGRSREVPPDELRRAVAELFGVRQEFVVAEYGMTELSSQLYETTLATAVGAWPDPVRHGLYAVPPWVRVTAVDPVTLALLSPGEVGLGRIVDLGNVDSAVAIQTADRVRVTDEGVELFGRAPGAVPRGCSIAADEMLGRS